MKMYYTEHLKLWASEVYVNREKLMLNILKIKYKNWYKFIPGLLGAIVVGGVSFSVKGTPIWVCAIAILIYFFGIQGYTYIAKLLGKITGILLLAILGSILFGVVGYFSGNGVIIMAVAGALMPISAWISVYPIYLIIRVSKKIIPMMRSRLFKNKNYS